MIDRDLLHRGEVGVLQKSHDYQAKEMGIRLARILADGRRYEVRWGGFHEVPWDERDSDKARVFYRQRTRLEVLFVVILLADPATAEVGEYVVPLLSFDRQIHDRSGEHLFYVGPRVFVQERYPRLDLVMWRRVA